MNVMENIKPLVDEYRALLVDIDSGSPESVSEALTVRGDWTGEGAAYLVSLAKDYGAFMLRNALALAIVLQIEDGELEL